MVSQSPAVEGNGQVAYPELPLVTVPTVGLQPESASTNASKYLHALRRRWLSVLGLGLLCGGLAGAGAWFAIQPKYTAVALVHVATQHGQLVFKTADRSTLSDFDVYKNTQQGILTSRFVLTAALRKPDVAKLGVVQRELDPIDWLQRELKVKFPLDAEIMRISLTTDDPKEASILVNAVVAAYMDEVVDDEEGQRSANLSELDTIYSEKETEVRKKRTDLRQLAEQLGAGDSTALSLKQQIALEEFADVRKEHTTRCFELLRQEGELKVLQRTLLSPDGPAVSDVELSAYARTDPLAVSLLARLDMQRTIVAINADRLQPNAVPFGVQENARDLESTEEQLDVRREELRADLQQSKSVADIPRLEAQIEVSKELVQQLALDLEQLRKTAEEVSGSSIDIEMMRAEIEHIEEVLSSVAEERERLKVELRSKSRVTELQAAEAPQFRDRTQRIPLTVLAVIAGFCVPLGGIVFWETRARRINSSEEVAVEVGVNVIGTLPMVPFRSIGKMSSSLGRRPHWQNLMRESVNGVAAVLLREAGLGQTRVVLVSSAMSGEGKTTLVTQLAMSLARSGFRTVLVDFDLRRPSLDRLFELRLEPGVSELLRGENDLADVVQETATGNLSVVPAGRWDSQSAAVLSNGSTGSLFKELREEYDFVLVDCGPVLPMVDSRLIGQHVDAVVFSVLRDVSQARKVRSALAILRSFDIRVMGAVVTGATDETYYAASSCQPGIPV